MLRDIFGSGSRGPQGFTDSLLSLDMRSDPDVSLLSQALLESPENLEDQPDDEWEEISLSLEHSQTVWYVELLQLALKETGDVTEALLAADLAFSLQPEPVEAHFGLVGDEWHGPSPPGSGGWLPLEPGPRGGLRWKHVGGSEGAKAAFAAQTEKWKLQKQAREASEPQVEPESILEPDVPPGSNPVRSEPRQALLHDHCTGEGCNSRLKSVVEAERGTCNVCWFAALPIEEKRAALESLSS